MEPRTNSDQPRVKVPQTVVYRHFVNETVVLNLTSGKYHGLNRTAGRMLELLDETGEVGATAAAAAREFGEPEGSIRADVEALCADLLERGILEQDATASGG